MSEDETLKDGVYEGGISTVVLSKESLAFEDDKLVKKIETITSRVGKDGEPVYTFRFDTEALRR